MNIIIPARGGSKRIPDKNIVDINGRPLISYTIEACLELTPDVYVSTDSDKIHDITIKHGARVVRRPDELATDTAKTETAINHWLRIIQGIEEFACVQATTPMLNSKSLGSGFNLLTSFDMFDSVISVEEKTEYLWNTNHEPINFQKQNRPRTQEMENIYSENGAFYITTKDSFRKNNCLYDGRVGFVVMSKLESLEIDTFEDLELVRKCMK